jgi:hypothetical protein
MRSKIDKALTVRRCRSYHGAAPAFEVEPPARQSLRRSVANGSDHAGHNICVGVGLGLTAASPLSRAAAPPDVHAARGASPGDAIPKAVTSVTPSDLGISPMQSHRWQKLGGMDDVAFEARVREKASWGSDRFVENGARGKTTSGGAAMAIFRLFYQRVDLAVVVGFRRRAAWCECRPDRPSAWP